ncbi:membrane protein [Gordonia phage Dorito]|uniref:Membrane protein n=1 Tax=Gordonia phage Dorito TaxID=2499023 RepID=A0A3S9UAH5_9CAUD|nr:membrane protein [Gordonia phage Dorito]AZS07292.1 membrane protein [Gordonia phage Dorito]
MTDNQPNTESRNGLPPTWLVNLVAVVICVAWIATLVVRILDPSRSLPGAVDTAMLIVAGFLFAGNLKGRGGNSS